MTQKLGSIVLQFTTKVKINILFSLVKFVGVIRYCLRLLSFFAYQGHENLGL